MGKKMGDQTIAFLNKPRIVGNYSIVGKKEGCGPFKNYFHYILKDDLFGESSFEHAERKMLEQAIGCSIKNAGMNINDVDLIVGGDLLNQIISTSFTARYFDRPFLGVYGACSTMAESLAIGATFVDGKYLNNVVCATGTHFSTAERQYRFPLELGNQRPPTSQWTVTGAGSTVLRLADEGHMITKATLGKVTDYGIKDANNMGAAMAPAAMSTLISHFKDTKTSPDDYDLILTGDLGKLGSEILMDLMEHNGYKLGKNYNDCGQMMYNNNQKTFQGGSGCGCSAAIFNSFILKKLDEGVYKNVLYAATGALLSTLSTQQGDSIPGICHAVVIERDSKVGE